MKGKNPTYKEQHGTTRVGDFLRSIGKGDLLKKIFGSASELITGDVHGAVIKLLGNSDELTEAQRQFSLKLLYSDLKENEEITNRWQSDNNSDSWLARNVRPIILLSLASMLFIFISFEMFFIDFTVKKEWIDLLQQLLSLVFVAYFGGRSFEKTRKL